MLSVIIPNYNGNKYLRNCIDTINHLNYSNIQIIIIDNDSRDSQYEWTAEYDQVVFKRLDQNYGFSRAVNEGIKIAQGEYVILLNNDTEIYEGFIEQLISCIKKDKTIFSVCSQMIQYHNPDLIDDAGDEYNLLGWAYKRGDGQGVDTYNQVEKVFSACAGAAIYRKSVFDEIGYFDENFFAYMEDVDLSYRALIHGYKNVYCPSAKVLHIGSATSGSKYNAFKVKLAARNNIYVPYKNMPLLQLLINMPFLMLGYLVKYLFFVKKGFGKAYREGFVEGLNTVKNIDKVKFRWKNIGHYFYIQWLLIKNTINYLCIKIRKK